MESRAGIFSEWIKGAANVTWHNLNKHTSALSFNLSPIARPYLTSYFCLATARNSWGMPVCHTEAIRGKTLWAGTISFNVRSPEWRFTCSVLCYNDFYNTILSLNFNICFVICDVVLRGKYEVMSGCPSKFQIPIVTDITAKMYRRNDSTLVWFGVRRSQPNCTGIYFGIQKS